MFTNPQRQEAREMMAGEKDAQEMGPPRPLQASGNDGSKSFSLDWYSL